MSSSQNVVEAVYARLTIAGALNTDLGGRIYHQLAGQNAVLPLLVFDVLSFPLVRTFGNNLTYTAEIHFDIFCERDVGGAAALGAGTLEEDLFANLDNQSLTVTGLDRGLVLFTDRGVRTIDEDTIRTSSTARLTGTTT